MQVLLLLRLDGWGVNVIAIAHRIQIALAGASTDLPFGFGRSHAGWGVIIVVDAVVVVADDAACGGGIVDSSVATVVVGGGGLARGSDEIPDTSKLTPDEGCSFVVLLIHDLREVVF
jgi:hypothetical protein